MSDYLDPANEELLKDFFSEAEMQVEMLESNVLVLERDPRNADAIDELFRAAHTLKGGAATVQMSELAEFTHLVEDALDEIRAGRASIDEPLVDVLLASIDIVKAMLEMRQSGEVFDGDTSAIRASLHRVLEGHHSASAPVGAGGPPPAASDPASAATPTATTPPAAKAAPTTAGETGGAFVTDEEFSELQEVAGGDAVVYAVTVGFREDNPMNSVGGIQLFSVLKQFGQVLKTVPEFEALYEDVYHPTVIYYVAATSELEEHEARFHISDVTASVEIAPVAVGGASGAEDVANEQPSAAPDTPSESTAAPPVAALADNALGTESGARGNEQEDTGSDSSPSQETDEVDGPPVAAAARVETRRGAPASSILRVDSSRIDNLLNLVSEIVINKAAFNQITTAFGEGLSDFSATESRYKELLRDLFDSLPEYLGEIERGRSVKEIRGDINERFGELPKLFDSFHGQLKGTIAKFRNTAQNLGRITGELQEGVMRIRMVPISQIFSRFPRLVRDLSRTLDKQVRLVIEGEDTELDKSVIEDLLDPLIHCVRNSIDHGIEDEETRAAAGKEPTGTVVLRASNEGNMILIEITDDGKGIDVDAVRKKAVDRGVIHPNKQLPDVEAFNLIFDPGFSTAAKITNVSGRGVGLDVVKRQIEKLNGSVAVWSERGKGSRFTIKIPLTLAIIQGLLVRVGAEMYAIPITSVIDSHRIRPSDIKMIDNYEVFNVREDVVSLIRLNRLFRIPAEENPEFHYVVIVGSSDRKMGLIVDSLIGEEDVVIKPLKDHFTNSPGIAGANITGDGKVSLIIDVSQLLDLGLRREREERDRRESNTVATIGQIGTTGSGVQRV